MPGMRDYMGGLGDLAQNTLGGGGMARDGAPQPLPGINPNLQAPPNYWQGNQLMIPGMPPPGGGMAGAMQGGMPGPTPGAQGPMQGGGMGGVLQQLMSSGNFAPLLAMLRQRMGGQMPPSNAL